MAVAMGVSAQQEQRDAAPAAPPALGEGVAHTLQLSVTGLPRRGESL
jgi:hypothetical protein